MAGLCSIGLVVTEHIAAGLVEKHQLVGEIHRRGQEEDLLRAVPAEDLVRMVAAEAVDLSHGQSVEAIGIAFPGIVREGVIEDSPNLPQLKGLRIEAAMRKALGEQGLRTRLAISNDADAIAAGLAATQAGPNKGLDKLIRVWTLGTGVGFGHYPATGGVWEGGHTVVSLDPNENFCACGGRGHLEGIMGHRAMRLRFLDREPEEIFAGAKTGPNSNPDPRCVEFALLWHRALAAATATSIHLEGPGKFYITGRNARFVHCEFLARCVQEMVKLTPLQSYGLEVVAGSDDLGIIGAAVNAVHS
jgi:predicted NBD/HSP70 family sugar kinase